MQAEQFIALSHNASLLITLPDHCQRLLDGEYPRSSNPSELVTLQSWPRFNTVLFLPLRSDLEHIPPMSPGPSEPPTILNAVLHHGPYRSQRLEKGVCVFLPLPHVSRHVTRCIVIPPGHRRCHAKGSYIFLQLCALGRTADSNFLEKQDPPSPHVSASSVMMTGRSKAPHPLAEGETKNYITA